MNILLNFSALTNTSTLGRFVRLPLRLVPPSAVLPILQGELRGFNWIASASNHGCWLGSYETAVQRHLSRVVEPGMICFDIGAHVGFHTLLMSRKAGGHGRVFAFEPVPENILRLRQHIAINRLSNVCVIRSGVAQSTGTRSFHRCIENTSMGKLAENGDLSIAVTSIDDFIQRHASPDVVKIDVEGAESEVLTGGRSLLSKRRSQFLISTHSRSQKDQCIAMLRAAQYRVSELRESPNDLVATP